MVHLTLKEIGLRILLTILIGGSIGFERQKKNRPAGLTTHTLVALGATVLALIQNEVVSEALHFAIQNPDLGPKVTVDQTRIIAQIVSGVGFLGAGTIIVTNRTVHGLTTAASLWATAALGIAIGMGYFQVALAGFAGVIFSLLVIKKFIKSFSVESIEIKYFHRQDTKDFLNEYFQSKGIKVEDVEFEVSSSGKERVYKNVYTLKLPNDMAYKDVIEDILMNDDVINARTISMFF